jgi:hypothetical protein
LFLSAVAVADVSARQHAALYVMLVKAILANTLVPFSVDDVVESLSVAVATHTSSSWTWISTQRGAAYQLKGGRQANEGLICTAGGTGTASGFSYSATLNSQVHFIKPLVRIDLLALAGNGHLRVPPSALPSGFPCSPTKASLVQLRGLPSLFTDEGFPCSATRAYFVHAHAPSALVTPCTLQAEYCREMGRKDLSCMHPVLLAASRGGAQLLVRALLQQGVPAITPAGAPCDEQSSATVGSAGSIRLAKQGSGIDGGGAAAAATATASAGAHVASDVNFIGSEGYTKRKKCPYWTTGGGRQNPA